MTLGQQVAAARKKMGMTQKVLANRSGISRFTVQAMEADRFEPSLKCLLKVTRELRACFTFSEGGTDLVVADVTALKGSLVETLASLKGRR
jgi:DNA-binding XRE family transcriptional regulator